jgi:hypothetical protein
MPLHFFDWIFTILGQGNKARLRHNNRLYLPLAARKPAYSQTRKLAYSLSFFARLTAFCRTS